ncbi:hypothetical protein D3C81_1387660 [compost metagenome]
MVEQYGCRLYTARLELPINIPEINLSVSRQFQKDAVPAHLLHQRPGCEMPAAFGRQ